MSGEEREIQVYLDDVSLCSNFDSVYHELIPRRKFLKSSKISCFHFVPEIGSFARYSE